MFYTYYLPIFLEGGVSNGKRYARKWKLLKLMEFYHSAVNRKFIPTIIQYGRCLSGRTIGVNALASAGSTGSIVFLDYRAYDWLNSRSCDSISATIWREGL